MACVIREGDPTTTGGTVVAGSSRYIAEHRQAARISDPVWCPACKSMGFIAEGNPTFIDEYLAVASAGHAVCCACPFGSNRLIATQNTIKAGEQATVEIAADLALRAEAATWVWARAIREGSYSSPFTSGIPVRQVRGLAPVDPCVFAKSCVSVPAGSTEAGSASEPAKNFGSIALLGSTGAVAPDGAALLGRVSGSMAAGVAESLGSWAIRGLAGAAEGLGAGAATAASTLVLALWPRDLGDSTLYTAEQLATMSAAATRVRFQFRKAADGSIRVYGLHTDALSGLSRVPTLEARWNADKSRMEAQLDGGLGIVWTPNDGPLPSEPLVFPIPSEPVETLLVHPIPGPLDSEIEVYPAGDDITWQDVILTFPDNPGVPPLYLVFAKPAVRPLEVGPASELQSRSRKDGLDIDHIPAQKVLEAILLASPARMSEEEIRNALRNAPGIAIPARVHQKYSETYGGRNTKAKQAQDIADLRAAIDNNFAAIKRGLLEEGYAEGDIEVARDQLHQLGQEQGWY
ncbi:S-type pyocin domain-containing protein [Pseudomonas aeruginosa]